jgi:hypothetical protein
LESLKVVGRQQTVDENGKKQEGSRKEAATRMPKFKACLE